ncbi:MAG: type II toxin-antitoxin system PemK/MazF family toxin [Proteobacteria bacterium]|nr:type II toxin-antitoxin system PemK/MazF family toxin [Pseudomonadota bacterium]
MAIAFAPKRGAILLCDFDAARISPEIDKRRQVIVVSGTTLNHRHGTASGLCTVVPTSSKAPNTVGREDFKIPVGKYWSFTVDSWVRCKLITTVSHSRLDLLLRGGRPATSEFLDDADMQRIVSGLRHTLAIP